MMYDRMPDEAFCKALAIDGAMAYPSAELGADVEH